jgi:hypothetical protein
MVDNGTRDLPITGSDAFDGVVEGAVDESVPLVCV